MQRVQNILSLAETTGMPGYHLVAKQNFNPERIDPQYQLVISMLNWDGVTIGIQLCLAVAIRFQ